MEGGLRLDIAQQHHDAKAGACEEEAVEGVAVILFLIDCSSVLSFPSGAMMSVYYMITKNKC
jgi:hypothetical protein